MNTRACLADKPMIAINRDSKPVSQDEITDLLEQIPQWNLLEEAGIAKLQRTFLLADFAAALELTEQIGALAEGENHHPAILTEWGKVTVTWWTHSIKGLHLNDFIMAARTDQLVSE